MKRSIFVAIVIAIAATVWVASGQLKPNNANKSEPFNTKVVKTTTKIKGKKFLVQVKDYAAQPRLSEIILRGRTEAARRLDIRAETEGKIRKVLAKEGKTVRTGEVLLKIAIQDRKARLREAVALVEQRQLEYDAASELSKRGHRSATKLAAAASQLETAIARQKKIDIDISHTTIRAPFEGVIERRYVELGDVVAKNTAVIHIVDKDPFLVVGQISEQDIGKINIGDTARAKLLNGSTVHGFIRFVSLTADQKTRTFRVEIEVPNKNKKLREGLTAEIFVATSEEMAHFLTPAVLTLNDAGLLGIRTVDENKIVRFRPVDIIEDTNEGVWVSGLPNRVRVITVGQEFVNEGEQVRIKIAGDQSS